MISIRVAERIKTMQSKRRNAAVVYEVASPVDDSADLGAEAIPLRAGARSDGVLVSGAGARAGSVLKIADGSKTRSIS